MKYYGKITDDKDLITKEFMEDNTTTDVQINSTSVVSSGIANVTKIPVTMNSTATTGKVTISTSDPSGGSNGDIWLKYEA